MKYIIRPEHQLKLEGASAQSGRRVLAHAWTFGQNWNVKFGTSFDLFQCQSTTKLLLSLTFITWHCGTPSDVGPIRKWNFSICLGLQPNKECPIQDIFWCLSLSKYDKNADFISIYEMAIGAYHWMLAQIARHISAHAQTFGLTWNVWFESSDICLCHNIIENADFISFYEMALVAYPWMLPN